jgi:hypothetical protein
MINKISTFLKANFNIIGVILMALFYCLVSYQILVNIDGFNPFYLADFPIQHRLISPAFFGFNILFGLILVCFYQNNWFARIKALAEINIVSSYIYLNYTLNSKQTIASVDLFGHNFAINTGLVVIPLIALLFWTVVSSLLNIKKRTSLLLAQVLLLFLTIFSVDSLLTQERTALVGFANFWVATIFSFPPKLWLITGTMGVSLLTIFWLKTSSKLNSIIQLFLFAFINLQGIYILKLISFNTFGFWHKALFMIIFWDAVYYLFRILNKNSASDSLNIRLNISMFYHALLMILLVILSIR